MTSNQQQLFMVALVVLLPVFLSGQADWQPLFNGKNLDGWTKVGTMETEINNGVLTMRAPDAQSDVRLMTNEFYTDFEFKATYRLKPGFNSGVFVRYQPDSEGHPSFSGYEINLDNRQTHPYPSGSIEWIARGLWLESLKPNDWNELYIKAEGDYLAVKMNGDAITQIHDRRSGTGQIGLQCLAGHEVEWKDVQVKKRPAKKVVGPQMEDYMRNTWRGSKSSIFDGKGLNGWEVVGDAQWVVVDGAIVGDTGPDGDGFLATKKAYENFYLKCKFWLAQGQNSGIFIRWDTTATAVSLDNSMEMNVYDPGTMEWGYPTGSIVQYARAPANITDLDDWNTMEIFAFGDHICIYVNGQKTSEAHVDAKHVRTGRICLQAGRQVATPEKGPSQVKYKDLVIRDFAGVPRIGY